MLAFKTYLFRLISVALEAYFLIVLAYCVATFFVRNRYASWFLFLQEMVEPLLIWIRRVLGGRTQIGAIDLSPIVLMIGLTILERLIHTLILSL